MRRGALLVAAALAGCRSADGTGLTRARADAIRDSIEQTFPAISRDLARQGPAAWLSWFADDSGFYMASDGRTVFPQIDSARAFVKQLARSVDSMSLVWEELRVDPVAPGVAVVGGSYRELIRDTAGSESRFTGYMTATVIHASDGWRLANLHWSSPAGE